MKSLDPESGAKANLSNFSGGTTSEYDSIIAGNPNSVRGDQNYTDGRALLASFSNMHTSLGNPVESSLNLAILVDLVLMGDGGLFTDRIVTPIFQALAYEVAKKGAAGCEPALRITYDDANESFVLPSNVDAIRNMLGVRYLVRRSCCWTMLVSGLYLWHAV